MAERAGAGPRHASLGDDSTGAFYANLAAEASVRKALGLADRVVLGSDFPNIPYPYEVQLDAIGSWGLGAAAEQAILHDNGFRLLQLSR